MIKVSDYIAKRLTEHGVKDVFMISGGGAMHLNDSIGKEKKLSYYCNHHEQASAIAAEGYSRATGKLAVVVVTSGPGGTNTLTGVIGEWLDSVPVLYISGQVKHETTIDSCTEIELRQLGDQEINIVDIVKPITKFAVMVKEPKEIKKLLDKAINIATSGRPGPVWLDIPLNVQGAMVDEKAFVEYDEAEDLVSFDQDKLESKVKETINLLKKSKRPVLFVGHGIRIAGGEEALDKAINQLKIPVVTSLNGTDLVPTDNKYYIGHNGTIGQRAGNFVVQNSDLLISVGSRNNIRQISYNWKVYARAAKKVIVDIDKAELLKPTIKADLAIQADARVFLETLLRELGKTTVPSHKDWLEWGIKRKNKYPVVLPEYKEEKEAVNPYFFIDTLTEHLDKKDIITVGNGSATVVTFQAANIKEKQKLILNSGCASMGYDLPASIGASIGINKGKVICIAGDGSIQMNLQELQTVVGYNLPIKIFYLNNNGYVSIKQTQQNFFQGCRIACCPGSGVSLPEISKISEAYGIKYIKISNHDGMLKKINEALDGPDPVVCEVMLKDFYIFSPKTSSLKKPDGTMVSKPLEDMYPFLEREEFNSNMLIETEKE
jgi:acetolactate synthase-1/2/3 large subunit